MLQDGTMPLTDRDPNASGRTSRASHISNMSTGSRGLQKGPLHGNRTDLFSSAPGVMSMLRTSTEIGDVGGLTYGSSNMPNVPMAPSRRGATSRMSTGSSHSNTSRQTSGHQPWPSASSGQRRSLTRDSNMPQYTPDTLSPTIMNLPGSSPLIPRSRSSRDVNGRSFSMTHTSQPAFGLSSNRSFASLGPHEHVQRPRSPYRYPTRLRRPGYRPASPALGDIPGTRPRRSQGNISHPRMRAPSNVSIHRDDRGLMPGHPGRSMSPTFLMSPHPDIPPVPPLHHHMVVEHTRMAHKPAKGSFSSGSTNQRTDSDAPSSDAPSPPTPKDGASMEVMVSPTGTRVFSDSIATVMKGDVSTGPLYYDYSEQFEREQYVEPEAEAVTTGFVTRIKTIMEERGTPVADAPAAIEISIKQDTAELPGSEAVDIAELPASPVPRRITRDLILEALDPATTTENVDMSVMSMEQEEQHNSAKQSSRNESAASSEDLPAISLPVEEVRDIRTSVVSQVNTSFIDSSTIDFAVRYSIPMVTGAGLGSGTTTEDGMSDLLDGYQHTETKQDGVSEQKDNTPGHASDRKSHHAQKSSDGQSFKSCTDLPAQYKDSDARSFTTCKDAVTPERAMSMPASRLPWLNQSPSEVNSSRPASEMPLASPRRTLRKKPTIPPHESSFSKVHARLRSNSKFSSRHGSTGASISSSMESVVQHHPTVPPRESSSSKEAQRTHAVAEFLVRLSRPRRSSKAQSHLEKQTKDEPTPQLNVEKSHDLQKIARDRPMEDKSAIPSPLTFKTPEKPTSLEQTPPDRPVLESSSRNTQAQQENMAPKLRETTINPPLQSLHQHSLSSPTPLVQEPSSVYSPDDAASFISRIQSTPVASPKSFERDRRDSQSTTHLVWHGPKISHAHTASIVSDPRPSNGGGHEETTTDLRMSTYRYPLHFLPDLKEESHEDSSLNTSASNLKNTSFRFPVGGHPGKRASVDGCVVLRRSPSARSLPKSNLAYSRGLPSMNFSRMDLIAKLNEALDIRVSFDETPEHTHELGQKSPVRPSTGEMREKYRSFFASLDEFGDSGDISQHHGTLMDLAPLKGQFSRDHLVAEIDRLTIPSVGGLTQRLSEFLPSLREYYKLNGGEFAAEEVIMEHAMEELLEVGRPAPKRSSARLRPVPGSPNMVVIEDALYEELTGKENENERFGGSSDESTEGTERESSNGQNNTRTRDRTPLAELEAPISAVLRTRSLSLGDQDLRPSLESRLSKRRSLRSLVNTPTGLTITDTRPWNSDKNYPWTTRVPSIDIALPAPTVVRNSPHHGPSPLRLRLSESSIESMTSPQHTHDSPTVKMPVSGSGDPHSHMRHQSRRCSLFTAYTKRASNPSGPDIDASGFAMAPLQVRGNDHTHEAGERYPTSALTPPINVHMTGGETSSHFSTDSEDEVPARPRKRKFKSLKSAFTPSSRPQGGDARRHDAPFQAQNQSQPQFQGQEGSLSSTTESMQDHNGEVRDFSASQRNTYINAAGMSVGTYRKNRLLEKLRTIWHKSGNLLRRVSRRKTKELPPLSDPTAGHDSSIRPITSYRNVRSLENWSENLADYTEKKLAERERLNRKYNKRNLWKFWKRPVVKAQPAAVPTVLDV